MNGLIRLAEECLFVAATRFYERNPELAEKSLERLRKWAWAAHDAGAAAVFIVVNAAEDRSGCLQAKWPDWVIIYPLYHWGKFVLPLNSLTVSSREFLAKGYHILFPAWR